jgi:hypothetical protein
VSISSQSLIRCCVAQHHAKPACRNNVQVATPSIGFAEVGRTLWLSTAHRVSDWKSCTKGMMASLSGVSVAKIYNETTSLAGSGRFRSQPIALAPVQHKTAPGVEGQKGPSGDTSRNFPTTTTTTKAMQTSRNLQPLGVNHISINEMPLCCQPQCWMQHLVLESFHPVLDFFHLPSSGAGVFPSSAGVLSSPLSASAALYCYCYYKSGLNLI